METAGTAATHGCVSANHLFCCPFVYRRITHTLAWRALVSLINVLSLYATITTTMHHSQNENNNDARFDDDVYTARKHNNNNRKNHINDDKDGFHILLNLVLYLIFTNIYLQHFRNTFDCKTTRKHFTILV